MNFRHVSSHDQLVSALLDVVSSLTNQHPLHIKDFLLLHPDLNFFQAIGGLIGGLAAATLTSIPLSTVLRVVRHTNHIKPRTKKHEEICLHGAQLAFDCVLHFLPDVPLLDTVLNAIREIFAVMKGKVKSSDSNPVHVLAQIIQKCIQEYIKLT